MTFRFHSLFLYTLPGVVVLLGYWWYVSQRRRRLSWQVEEVTGVGVTAGLVKSPAEREESLVEQEALLKSYVTMFAKPQEQLEEGLVDPQNEVFEVFLSAGAIEGPNEVRIQRRTASSAERPEPEGKVTEGLWAEMDNVDVSLEGPKLKLSCLEESRGSCSSSPACVELYNVETGSAWLPEECNTSEPEGQLQQSNVTKPCAADMETQPSNAAYFSVGKQGYMDNSVRMVGDTDGKCCEESCLSDRLMEENHFAGSVDMADFHFYSNTHSACPPNRSLADLVEWEIQVPNRLVGRLIGKKGRSVNFLKRRSGAKIYVFNATQDLQVCHIEGSKAQVDRALALIGKKFSELDLTNQRLALGHHLLPEAWMRLPEGELARVIVVKVVSPSQMFIQWNESTIQRALHSLEERMTWCYSQPEASPRPARAQRGELCAAPGPAGGWRRAQLTGCCGPNTAQILYVDHGGYESAGINMLRRLRSEFLSLPFQGIEVMLDNLGVPQGKRRLSVEVTSELEEMMSRMDLLVKCVGYHKSGVPLVRMWKVAGDEELVSVNQLLVQQGFATWE